MTAWSTGMATGGAAAAGDKIAGLAVGNVDTLWTAAQLKTFVSNAPSLVTPDLGTPSAGTLTNCTGFPASGLAGLGAGVATFLATPSSANLRGALTDETGTGAAVFAASPALTTPNIGTPSAGVLTNCTGLPVGSGISGFGTGIATFLATPSSANLRGALTDETGTGAAVFATSPSISTPVITGFADASSAGTGVVGQTLTASLASGSAVSLSTSTVATVVTLSLTAGDWLIYGTCVFKFAATTSYTVLNAGLSATAASVPGAGAIGMSQHVTAANVPTAVSDIAMPVGPIRISTGSTANYYLSATAVFTVSTLTAYGVINAVRIR